MVSLPAPIIETKSEVKTKVNKSTEQLNKEPEIKLATAQKDETGSADEPDVPKNIKINTGGNEVKDYAKARSAEMFGDEYWNALHQLWQKESGWQVGRANKEGACGLPQSLPCSKIYGYEPARTTINGKLFIVSPDYRKEIDWGLSYIKNHYQNPSKAWQVWQSKKWY